MRRTWIDTAVAIGAVAITTLVVYLLVNHGDCKRVTRNQGNQKPVDKRYTNGVDWSLGSEGKPCEGEASNTSPCS